MQQTDNNVIVTTVENANAYLIAKARSYARQLNTLYISRDNQSINTLKEKFQVDNILTVSKHGPILHTIEGKYFFHLSMAELRIKNYLSGDADHMIYAMNLKAGMNVLDCTLGLATDAVVASYVVGPQGKVTGLEASPLLALIAKEGLASYKLNNEIINAAMRNIRVINSEHLIYLQNLPDKCYDIVYFDPMFRYPKESSCNLKPIRRLANNSQLSLEAIQEAKRIARSRVVIKENNFSKEFDRLGITVFSGGKYSSIKYGIIEVKQYG